MQEIVFWLLGSVSNRSLQDVWIILPFTAIGWGMILYCGRLLDALTLGEETAHSLGFDVKKMRWIMVIGVASCVGAAVSVSGTYRFCWPGCATCIAATGWLSTATPVCCQRDFLVAVRFLLLLADITVQLYCRMVAK
jgi:iron complex transport system permease protein